MTVIYPYSLAWLADILPISSVVWDIKRNDIISGKGSGRIWQTELADPLWIVDIELDDATYTRDAKRYAARIRKLHGAQEAFFLYDPVSQYPASDPNGSVLGAAVVSIASIGADSGSLSLTGLPAGYQLTDGDKFSLTYGVPTLYAFFEVSEPVVADATGTTPEFGIFPHIEPEIAAGMVVTLARPYCRMIIEPESHRPGRARRTLTEGAGFRAIQQR